VNCEKYSRRRRLLEDIGTEPGGRSAGSNLWDMYWMLVRFRNCRPGATATGMEDMNVLSVRDLPCLEAPPSPTAFKTANGC